jgi:hypothetical protein
MKKIFFLPFTILVMLFFTSCIKDDIKTPTTSPKAEFDATVTNTPATGLTYPVLTRVAGYGRPVYTGTPNTDPLITRTSGVVKFRINLVGQQFPADQTITYKVVATPAGYTAAVVNTHFTVSGTAVIPANTSFAEIAVNVVNTGASSTTPVVLVLEIIGNEQVQPNANFRFLGISIAQN